MENINAEETTSREAHDAIIAQGRKIARLEDANAAADFRRYGRRTDMPKVGADGRYAPAKG